MEINNYIPYKVVLSLKNYCFSPYHCYFGKEEEEEVVVMTRVSPTDIPSRELLSVPRNMNHVPTVTCQFVSFICMEQKLGIKFTFHPPSTPVGVETITETVPRD